MSNIKPGQVRGVTFSAPNDTVKFVIIGSRGDQIVVVVEQAKGPKGSINLSERYIEENSIVRDAPA